MSSMLQPTNGFLAFISLFENDQYYKCCYFVCVGVVKMLYLTRALSAVLRTHVTTATRLCLFAQNSHSSVKKHLFHLVGKTTILLSHTNILLFVLK